MRVAIVHDYLTQRGGAERVVLSLHRLFPRAPIFTSVYDSDGTFPEFGELDVRTTFLQRLPHRGERVRRLLPLYPLAFGRLRLEGYDLVISSSSGWAHGVRAPGARHLCYCYTPARWLYQTDRYLQAGNPVPWWARPVLAPTFAALRRWDRAAARRPDAYVAISRAVAERIRTVYGRDAQVVHPPVGLRQPAGAVPRREPYFVALSRLLPYKRVDLAIGAVSRLGRRLVVVGEGPAEAELRARARERGADVDFRAKLSDDELTTLLARCQAVIQAGEEDFGLVPLEANSLGRPVVAYAASGALDTVVDGVSGVLFAAQTEDALAAALQSVERREWDPIVLREHARRFSETRFHRELRDAVDRVLTRAAGPRQLGREQRGS